MSDPAASPFASEAASAVAAAEAAAEVLRGHAAALPEEESKERGEPVSAADRDSDVVIRSRLEDAWPRDAMLSEEAPDDGRRLRASRVWIVDPLDGTKDFLRGSGEFAVHIGLVVDGEPVLGVVAAPATRQTWLGLPGTGAWVREGERPWEPIRPSPPGDPLRIAVTRSHLGQSTLEVAALLPPHELHRCGSAGLKSVLVADGTCDVYPGVTRRMKEWDLCAPHAVAAAAGASCTDLEGGALVYNQADVRARRGFLVTTPDLLERIRPVLERLPGVLGW